MPSRRLPPVSTAAPACYGYDTMTLVGPGTWEAARGAVDAALTAVDLVAAGRHEVAYALCRPPGHHVTRDGYGGSCYLNNAGVAAEALRRAATTGSRSSTSTRITATERRRSSTTAPMSSTARFTSTRLPAGFPTTSAMPTRPDAVTGSGPTTTVRSPEGTPDDIWLEGVATLVESVKAHGASALVVSLGVDAAINDPESPLQITESGYRQAGEQLATLDLPTVAVQEGGYHLPSLGNLVVATVTGLESRG